jgi:hypothetical protein
VSGKRAYLTPVTVVAFFLVALITRSVTAHKTKTCEGIPLCRDNKNDVPLPFAFWTSSFGSSERAPNAKNDYGENDLLLG